MTECNIQCVSDKQCFNEMLYHCRDAPPHKPCSPDVIKQCLFSRDLEKYHILMTLLAFHPQ